MPLLNLDELYGPSLPGMNTVIQPLLHAAERANVDPARVYLIGHSMSAHATWNLGLHYPTYFAAINPLAGAATRRLAAAAADEPVQRPARRLARRDRRGDQGRLLAIDREGAARMKIDVDYEETKELGHAPPPDVLERTYGKVRARVRELYPKTVDLQSNRPDTIFNRNDWLQIYQPLSPGKGSRLLLRRGSGPMRVYENSFARSGRHSSAATASRRRRTTSRRCGSTSTTR